MFHNCHVRLSRPVIVERFADLKFGLFIHWGGFLYDSKNILENFKPDKFDAREWVDLARTAGCSYMTFTTKHHDGFCMFHSKHSQYSSVETPAGKDYVALLAEECARQDMPLFLYYSLHDLHHPMATPGNKERYKVYVDYMIAQLDELCTNYGEISGFWLDQGPYHQGPRYPYRLDEIKRLIRKKQPSALIMGDDYYESEKSILPSFRPYGINGDKRLEVCDTLGDSWSHQEGEVLKSEDELIENLVRVVAAGGNYLLNIGPKPDGSLDPRHVDQFVAIGKWLSQCGEAIYGTRPFPLEWTNLGLINGKCYVMADSNHVYLHLFNWDEDEIILYDLGLTVLAASILNGPQLDFAVERSRVVVDISCRNHLEPDTVVVLSVS